jgi:hypothetical protein
MRAHLTRKFPRCRIDKVQRDVHGFLVVVWTDGPNHAEMRAAIGEIETDEVALERRPSAILLRRLR